MTPAALADLVRSSAVQVLAARGIDDAVLPEQVTIERPRNPDHGDYATNLALQVAKKAGMQPREFALTSPHTRPSADAVMRPTPVTSSRAAGP